MDYNWSLRTELVRGNVKRFFKTLYYAFIFIVLTALTQIGGVVFLLSLAISKIVERNFTGKTLAIFIPAYVVFTLLVIPFSASKFGRTKVTYAIPANYGTVLLNRNYVRPEINTVLRRLDETLKKENPNFNIYFLDANFPFFDGFPLLPHLSHSDGKKLDISLVYETQAGEISNKQKSVSGYGVFEGPQNGETDQIAKCKDAGYFQYDFPKFLTFGRINKELKFSEKGTKLLLENIIDFYPIEKVFIEPHLKQRLNLDHPKIRYHGCGAVRHDDHIHIQVK